MQDHIQKIARQDAVRAFDTLVARLKGRLPHAAEEIYLQKGLVAQAEDLPEWWLDGDNTLVAPVGFRFPQLSYIGLKPPRGAIVIIGAHCHLPNQILLSGDNTIVFLGPHCNLPGGSIFCFGDAMIVLTGNLYSIGSANLDARNGGLIYVGDDNLWSSGVKINTDDMHAIFDHSSLSRINRYGTIVTVGTHVWLGSDILINPGVAISDNVVVGSRSVVTKAIPAGVVVAGAPARVVKKGIVWTREDISPKVSLSEYGIVPLDINPGRSIRRFKLMAWLKGHIERVMNR